MAEAGARSRGGLLLYCVRACAGGAPPPLPPGARGVLGAELRWIARGDLAALVSAAGDPAALAAPAAAELLRYQAVIQEQHAAADVLPMRFGGVLADDEAVRAHLEAQGDAYRGALARLSGCVEMGVRALLEAPAPPREGPAERASGAAYLRARQRRYAGEEDLRRAAVELLEREYLPRVAPLCREHRVDAAPQRSGGPSLCSFYFLIPREEVPAFREALAPLLQGGARQIVISGPWPPYSFVWPR